jgi:hypothetical protein
MGEVYNVWKYLQVQTVVPPNYPQFEKNMTANCERVHVTQAVFSFVGFKLHVAAN